MTITFTLDGKQVTAADGETIWDVAKRHGNRIPHLCHLDRPGYRPDGNCRACMVEVEGERVLAASCIRRPAADMVVQTMTERADKARRMVFEMLASDMPARAESPDDRSAFWDWAGSMGIAGSARFGSKFGDPLSALAGGGSLSPLAGEMSPKVTEGGLSAGSYSADERLPDGTSTARRPPLSAAPTSPPLGGRVEGAPPPHRQAQGGSTEAPRDLTNPAIAVNLDACIACNACVRACREVQVNDVLGMGERGGKTVPVFDIHDPMGFSTCVTCGECVEACPTGALYEKTLMDAAGRTRAVKAFDRVVDSVCPFCGVGCQTKVAVKDDRIVKVDGRNGPANENRLCVKGRFGFDYVHSPDRLTKPLIRRDDAPKRGDIDMRGVDPLTVFREATWPEALARAASGLKAIHDRDGGHAIAGFGSAKGSNEEAYLFQKLIRQGFGTNNVDHCTRLCHASSVAALMEGVGSGAVSAPFMDALKADCIIVIGARPTTNHPVAATYFKQAAKAGKKLVVIDPRRQDLMRHAAHSLVFKPGTDVALLNALINVVIAEKLYDEQYIQANVSGFEALKEKVKDFTPEAMAEVCGIPAETLRDVARLYAKSERSIIFWGMGISQHTHGTDNSRCLIALALITGHVGRPGTGLHPLRGQNNVQGASDAGLIPMVYPDYQSVENEEIRHRFEDLWGRPLDVKRGLTVVEIIDAIHDGAISGMYIMGENPAMSDPDQSHARAALAKLKHLVVQDIFLTETAWHADVVLPASAHAEKLGTYTNTNRQVQIGRPALPLPGEVRQDWQIVASLAEALGLGWTYESVSDVYAEMASVMPSLTNISWERVEREGSVTYPADAPDRPGNEVIFAQGFPTADGRGRIVPADLLPPAEVPDEDYPLVLTTGRLLEHWHTGAMTRRAGVLDAIEPEGIAAMNPREIERRGLRQGMTISVETRRGKVEALLRADREVADGMVFMPFCFNESPANALTNPQLDPFGKIPEFKFCAARVEKAEAVEPAE